MFCLIQPKIHKLAQSLCDSLGLALGRNIAALAHYRYSQYILPLQSLCDSLGLALRRNIAALAHYRYSQYILPLQSLCDSLGLALSFVILLLVTCIWAILGTALFNKYNDTEFATFADALFTMFQVSKPYNKTLLLLVVLVRPVHHVPGQQTI